jgi:preprotein translocase subunit SecG
MYIFVLIIHIIVSLILVAVILLQTGKGGGLAETFGGGGSSQTTIFGQKSGAFLTKATEVSAVLFLCTSLTLAYLSSKKEKSIMDGVRIMPAGQEQAVTVREFERDPETGEQIVVKEETRPVTEAEKQK